MKIANACLLTLACAGAFTSDAAAQQTAGGLNTGELRSGDPTLTSGEYYDELVFEGRAGQRVIFDLTTSDFDPYLMVITPSGATESNDDFEDALDRSRIELTLNESGRYEIVVTSFEDG